MLMAKKICFVTVRNIYAISCLPRYRKLFGDTPFDIIYWDRNDIEENCGAENHYAMKYRVTNNSSKRRKLYGYFKFIQFAKKVLKENSYDVLIILPTQTGILLNNIIRKRYMGKYILDIRDFTAENNKLFYMLEKKIIKDSGLTIITSPAYKNFLPKHDYLISHNTAHVPNDLIKQYRKRNKSNDEKIVISCIGGIRFYEQFKRVISYFKNDNRYILRFIGNGSEGLKDYCEQNKIQNVELVGRFTPDKTLDYYMDTDVILNLYGNNNPLLDYALSNKLYYAATFGMPILVCPDTYMEDVAVGNGFGFTFNLEGESMSNKFYDYYQSIDWSMFYMNCDSFMKSVNSENLFFEDLVRKFIDNDKE
jgi:hypothetical protein